MMYSLKSDCERRDERNVVIAIGFALVIGIFVGLLLMGYHTPAEKAAMEQVQALTAQP